MAFISFLWILLLTISNIGSVKITPKDFEQNYVSTATPILLEKHLAELTEKWPSEEQLKKLPETYTSYVQLSDGSEISLGNFLTTYKSDKQQIQSEIPQSYRNKMELPKLLSCLTLRQKNLKMFLTSNNNEIKQDAGKNTLLCQWHGKLAYKLKPTDETSEADNKQSLETLNPDDCLFIPKGSYFTTKPTTEYSWSILLSWSTMKMKDECETKETSQNFGDYVPNTADNSNFALLQYLIATLAVQKTYEKSEFEKAIKDDMFLSNIGQESSISEAFDLLDVNADGKLNVYDFGNISKKRLNEIAEKLNQMYDSVLKKEPADETQADKETKTDAENEGDEETTIEAEDTDPGAQNLNLDMDMDSLLSGAFGSAMEEVLQSEEFRNEAMKELKNLQDIGIDLGKAKDVLDVLTKYTKDKTNDEKLTEKNDNNDEENLKKTEEDVVMQAKEEL